jgi:hypothetical protein
MFCSSNKKNNSSLGKRNNSAASVPKSTEDGLSYSIAIAITETSETKELVQSMNGSKTITVIIK